MDIVFPVFPVKPAKRFLHSVLFPDGRTVSDGKSFVRSGNAPVSIPCLIRKNPRHFPPFPDDSRGRPRHGFLKNIQHGPVAAGVGPYVPEDRVPLLQADAVLLQRDEVTAVHLADHHIQVPPAQQRPFPDQVQVLRGKNDAAKASHQVGKLLDPLAVNQDFLFLRLGRMKADRHLAQAEAIPDDDRAGRVSLSRADDVRVIGHAVAPAKCRIVDRFQQVGLPGSVLPVKQVDFRIRRKFRPAVIPEVFQFQFFYPHTFYKQKTACPLSGPPFCPPCPSVTGKPEPAESDKGNPIRSAVRPRRD